MHYAYIRHSEDGGLYIGHATDLVSDREAWNNKHRRFVEHQNGLSKSTKHHAPVRLVHYEVFQDNADARAREKYLENGYGREQQTPIPRRSEDVRFGLNTMIESG